MVQLGTCTPVDEVLWDRREQLDLNRSVPPTKLIS